MSVFFAMVGEGDDRRPAFFLTRASAPAGAVEITDARHRALLDGQSAGRAIISDARSRPALERRRVPSANAMRAMLTAAVRREAGRRIRAMSPEWRQLNDMREPTDAGALRFARIDAIRAASDAIEDLITIMPAPDLGQFSVANHPIWPEFD